MCAARIESKRTHIFVAKLYLQRRNGVLLLLPPFTCLPPLIQLSPGFLFRAFRDRSLCDIAWWRDFGSEAALFLSSLAAYLDGIPIYGRRIVLLGEEHGLIVGCLPSVSFLL